ncbi:MAG: response regulator [Chitinophagaceae bacterium BSSC1]|nr:MAG: response regulator [Chitinophagaceae bacterium BSSC1]
MQQIQHVCVIDDDEIYIYLIKKSLAALELEHSINAYANGAEALKGITAMIDQQQPVPEVIFLDINMPIMDGWEFLKAFRTIQAQLPKQIPIYIISSSIAAEDKEKAKRFPEIVGYLSKPVELETLASIIQKED